MNFYARLILVVLVVVALAEIIPEAINAILILVIVGLLLKKSGTFAGLLASLKL
jgi:hypothetical protein